MRFVVTMRSIGEEHEEQTQTARRRAANQAHIASVQRRSTGESANQPQDLISTGSEAALGKRKRDCTQMGERVAAEEGSIVT
jgi:hypothetical protein